MQPEGVKKYNIALLPCSFEQANYTLDYTSIYLLLGSRLEILPSSLVKT